MGTYPKGFFNASSTTSSNVDSVVADNFSSKAMILEVRTPRIMIPVIIIIRDIDISVIPIPRKPSCHTSFTTE